MREMHINETKEEKTAKPFFFELVTTSKCRVTAWFQKKRPKLLIVLKRARVHDPVYAVSEFKKNQYYN